MAVNIKYQNLSYVRQPDAKPLDLTSFKELGNAYVATAKSLEQRAIANENAYNEMAIKMSELNAAPGVDEESLAGKINDVQNEITKTVDEEGTWAFSDTAVSDGARKFLTDKGVKTIMASRQDYEAHQQALAQSDASEEFKKLALAKSLEDYNNAGGALGGDGNQRYMSYQFTLGKGHDRSVMQKEIVDYISKMEANKEFAYSEEFMQQSLQVLKDPNASATVKQTARQIIASSGNQNLIQAAGLDTLYGYKGITENVTYLDKGRIRELITHIVSSRPEFRQALEKEAQLLRWSANKQGYTNYQLATKALTDMANSNEYLRTQLLASSSFSKLNDKQKLEVSKSPELVNRYIEEGLNKVLSTTYAQQIGESDEAYEARMGALYDTSYYSDGMNQLISIGDSYTYAQREGDVKVQWFDNLLNNERKANKAKIDEIESNISSLNVVATNVVTTDNELTLQSDRIKALQSQLDTDKVELASLESKIQNTPSDKLTESDYDAVDILKQRIRETELAISKTNSESIAALNNLKLSDIGYNEIIEATSKVLGELLLGGDGGINLNYLSYNTKRINKEDVSKIIDSIAKPDTTLPEFINGLSKYMKDNKMDTVYGKSIDTEILPLTIALSAIKNPIVEEVAYEAGSLLKLIFGVDQTYEAFGGVKQGWKDLTRHEMPSNITDVLFPKVVRDQEVELYTKNNTIPNLVKAFKDAFPDKVETLKSKPYYLITSNDNYKSEFNSERDKFLQTFKNNMGTFTCLNGGTIKNGKYEIDNDLVGLPLTNEETFAKVFSTVDKTNSITTTYKESDIKISLMANEDGNTIWMLYRPVQGKEDEGMYMIVSTSDSNIQAQGKSWFDVARKTAAVKLSSDPDNVFYKDSYDKIQEVSGYSIPLGYDATKSEERNATDLYIGNTVNGNLCGTVNEAISNIIAVNTKNEDRTFDIYPNGMRVTITKTKYGNYIVVPHKIATNDDGTVKLKNKEPYWQAYSPIKFTSSGEFKTGLSKYLANIFNLDSNLQAIKEVAFDLPQTYSLDALF